MKRLFEKCASVGMWLLGSFLLLTTFGCGSLIFPGGPTEALLEVHEEKLAAFPTNIGLLEEGLQETKPIIVTVPPKVELENDPKTIFWESPLLKTQELASRGWKNVKRGGNQGARAGLMVGKIFCLALYGAQACPTPMCVAAAFLLCGGGVVGGTGVGWVTGGVVGSVIYPLGTEKVQEDFSLVQQNIIQAIWKKLMSKGKMRRSDSLRKKINMDRLDESGETFEFGFDQDPYNGFLHIRPLHFQLFQEPYDGPDELTLRIRVKWTLFDRSRFTLMEEEIQVDKGPYSYEEWSDANEWLLKSHLDNAYEDIARHIVSDLQMTPHFLHPKPPIISKGGS